MPIITQHAATAAHNNGVREWTVGHNTQDPLDKLLHFLHARESYKIGADFFGEGTRPHNYYHGEKGINRWINEIQNETFEEMYNLCRAHNLEMSLDKSQVAIDEYDLMQQYEYQGNIHQQAFAMLYNTALNRYLGNEAQYELSYERYSEFAIAHHYDVQRDVSINNHIFSIGTIDMNDLGTLGDIACTIDLDM